MATQSAIRRGSNSHFGEIRATLARQGKPIGPYDLQIAAISVTHDLTLVTDNVDEFSRVPRLKIENWQRG
jgi:tRNA(fMet)-specific endonuclease VapC